MATLDIRAEGLSATEGYYVVKKHGKKTLFFRNWTKIATSVFHRAALYPTLEAAEKRANDLKEKYPKLKNKIQIKSAKEYSYTSFSVNKYTSWQDNKTFFKVSKSTVSLESAKQGNIVTPERAVDGLYVSLKNELEGYYRSIENAQKNIDTIKNLLENRDTDAKELIQYMEQHRSEADRTMAILYTKE